MPHRNADAKPTNSPRRAGSRLVGPDEFKHELLKFARRNAKEAKNVAVVSVEVANWSTLTSAVDEEAMDRLVRGMRSALSQCTRPAHVLTALSPGKILVLESDDSAVDELVQAIRSRLSKLTLSGSHVRPIFEVRSGHTHAEEIESALDAVGCELDQHGDLRERIDHRDVRNSGSNEQWFARYDLENGVIDRWRNAACEMASLQSLAYKQLSAQTMIKRAKALQAIDHPCLQPLRDFWIDSDQCICITDVLAPKAQPIAQWIAAHKINAAAFVDLAMHYLSALIYEKTLGPPQILAGWRSELYLTPADTKMLFAKYHLQKIGGAETQILSDAELIADLADFCQLLSSALNEALPDGLRFLLDQINNADQALDTIYKVRAAFKTLSDKLGAPCLTSAN